LAEVQESIPEVKVVLFGMDEDPDIFIQAVSPRHCRYVLKNASATDLLEAVRTVAKARHLTSRQTDILKHRGQTGASQEGTATSATRRTRYTPWETNDDDTVQQISGLVIGTVESVFPNEIKVLIELDAPNVTALNTGTPTAFPRLNGYVLNTERSRSHDRFHLLDRY